MKCKKVKIKDCRQHAINKNISNVATLHSEQDNREKMVMSLLSPQCHCGLMESYPPYLPWIIYVCVFAFRFMYVSQKQNWWILHPDEIFQSVEVAFSEVFGYGFRTYEYLPPPVNVTTAVEEQELAYGMYSLRSFLFPRFYIAIFHLANFLGISYNPYLFARQVHVCVTSFLPVSIYYLTKSMYACPAVSAAAAIMVAFCPMITVLGTHTLVNSFTSPFIFLAIIPFVSYTVDTSFMYLINKAKQLKREACADQASNINNTSTPKHNKSKPKAIAAMNQRPKTSNNNIPSKNENGKAAFGNIGNSSIKDCSEYINYQRREHRMKYIIANFIGGVAAGVLIYIRFDLSLFVGAFYLSFLGLFIWCTIKQRLCTIVFSTVAGVILGILIGGLEDCYRYNACFISPVQWCRFNVITNIPSILFGTTKSYIKSIFPLDPMGTIQNIFSILGFLALVLKGCDSLKEHLERQTTMAICLVNGIVFTAYSIVEHKETRFLHNFKALTMIIQASCLHTLVRYITSYKGNNKARVVAISAMVMYVVNWYSNFQHMDSMNELHSSKRSSDINDCVDFIGRRHDVTGVFIDQSIYVTGGFSMLKKDVPLIILIHNEYHEYRNDNQTIHTPHLRVVNRFSDFISVTNVDYLGKVLTQNQEYNYIVTSEVRKGSFSDIGFKQIYSSGTYIVLHRKLPKREATILKNLGNKMKLGQNSTVLEYESSWLYTAGVYNKAIERLEESLKLDDSRIRPFQILGMSYVKVNNWPKALEIEQRCYNRHGKSKCTMSQPRLVLHRDYEKFDLSRKL